MGIETELVALLIRSRELIEHMSPNRRDTEAETLLMFELASIWSATLCMIPQRVTPRQVDAHLRSLVESTFDDDAAIAETD